MNPPHVAHGGTTTDRTCDQGVGSRVGSQLAEGAGEAQRRTWVKTEPAKEQNDRTQNPEGQVVGRNHVCAAVLVKTTNARANGHRASQSDRTTDHVHHARTGKVDCAVTEASDAAQVLQPAAAPDPATHHRVDEHADPQTAQAEASPLDALSHRAGGYGRCGIHEHHLEDKEG